VINGQHYSGAERVQDLLAARLPEFGFDVAFACVVPDRFPEMRRSKDAVLHEVPMWTKFDFRAAWKVARLVRDEDYRLVHAHTPRTALVGRGAVALSRVPMVYHVHSPASRDTTYRLRNRTNAICERWCLRKADRLIAVSHSIGRHMEGQGFDPSRIAVVPNGVPKVDTVPNRPAPCGAWTLGTVALFRPRKGIEVLIEALAVLRREGLPVRVRAVGPFETPEFGARLRALAERLGVTESIQWTGFTRDVGAELQKMDLFVLPSLFGEGLPMVVLEAMAAGVPVVATAVEGVPEAIRDGRDGAIARPNDAEDLSRAIGRIVHGELDWSQLRASALTRHARRFSDRSMAAGVAAVYREVLGMH